jgi:hypothetical protein
LKAGFGSKAAVGVSKRAANSSLRKLFVGIAFETGSECLELIPFGGGPVVGGGIGPWSRYSMSVTTPQP